MTPLFFHKYKKYIVLFAIPIFILLFLFINDNSKHATKISSDTSEEIVPDMENDAEGSSEVVLSLDETIQVDIKGAIRDPGVYKMELGQRVYEAIEAAGGFDKTAARDGINLATKLHDEMLVYVPFVGEDLSDLPTVQNNQENNAGIRINQATANELESLPGIGPSKADAIMQYIEENGPIQEVNDLLNISGIGEKTLEKFEDNIIVP